MGAGKRGVEQRRVQAALRRLGDEGSLRLHVATPGAASLRFLIMAGFLSIVIVRGSTACGWASAVRKSRLADPAFRGVESRKSIVRPRVTPDSPDGTGLNPSSTLNACLSTSVVPPAAWASLRLVLRPWPNVSPRHRNFTDAAGCPV